MIEVLKLNENIKNILSYAFCAVLLCLFFIGAFAIMQSAYSEFFLKPIQNAQTHQIEWSSYIDGYRDGCLASSGAYVQTKNSTGKYIQCNERSLAWKDVVV